MTSTTVASNGETTSKDTPTPTRDGLARLRREEGRALIRLGCEAISQAHSVAHDLHILIYAKDGEFDPAKSTWVLEEALACWETADHYLRMLGSALADYDLQAGNPASS